MANSLLTISMITRKAIQLFRNSNAFIKMIDRQYDSSYAIEGAKIGATLRIRLPNDYTIRTGQTAVVQNTTENQVSLTLATQVGVDVSFSSSERALSLDDFADRVLAPMINNLAGAVAVDVMSGVENIPNLVHNVDGSNNTITPTATTWLQAGAVLDRFSAPRDERNIIIDPLTMARTVASLTGLFNPQEKVSRQYTKGLIFADTLGFDWAMDQDVRTHTSGGFATGTVNGTANQTGSTIAVTAITYALTAGDIITFAGVYSVNRVQKQSTGQLMQFVVTANVAAAGTAIPIYPALQPQVAGVNVAYQTVTASPAAGAVIAAVINGTGQGAGPETYRKNFGFHPTAATLATADLQLPTGAVLACHREAFDGVSIRCIDDYLTATDQWLTRTDILYGYVWPRPEWAVIVADAL